MKLSDIIGSSKNVRLFGDGSESVSVSSIEYNSSQIKDGSLFAAVEGFSADGHKFIDEACKKGAAAVLLNETRAGEFSYLAEKGIAVLQSSNVRKALAELSAAFYGFPSKRLKVIGITGTNGKTSAAYMIESALKACGCKTGVIGTINVRWGDKLYPALNTTPESRDLQRTLSNMAFDGVEYAVMEVSSHALELERAAFVDFDAAAFTNLTSEHLDFHGDMESYFSAKLKLFDLLESSSKKNKTAAVNSDDSYGRRILSACTGRSFTASGFGLSAEADFRAEKASVKNKLSGLAYSMASPFVGEKISLKCAGGFQLYNSLLAISVLYSMGFPFEKIRYGLEALDEIPGRFQTVKSNKGVFAVVDYAHTGDALDKLLTSVNAMKTGRLITVFGCGGDRDKTKRPVMGRIASEKSDWVIVTSDNPRTENPETIIADIKAGISKDNFTVIVNRREAIREAAREALPGDIVVLAGKGHENYQIIGKDRFHFDDTEEIRSAFSGGEE